MMLQRLQNNNVARVARGRFCNKIAGIMLQNIHRIEHLKHVADIGDSWLQVQLFVSLYMKLKFKITLNLLSKFPHIKDL